LVETLPNLRRLAKPRPLLPTAIRADSSSSWRGDKVGITLLAAGHGGVAQLRAHDRLAERQPVLDGALKLSYRQVLAACHAVQVGVEHPHGRYGVVGQLGRPGHEFLLLNDD